MRYIKRGSLKNFLIIALAIIGIGCHKGDETLSMDQYIANGRQFNAAGKVDEAIESFKKAIKLKPESSDLHYELGVIYYEEWGKSLDTAQQQLIVDLFTGGHHIDNSKKEDWLVEHGYRKEFYNSALSEFAEAIKYDPSYWRARSFIASDLYKNKKYKEAIVEFKQIIQEEPRCANSYTFLGQAYLQTGQYQLAIDTLEKAANMDVAAEHWYYLGLAYKRVNDWAKVGKMAKKLKDMKSNFYTELLNTES